MRFSIAVTSARTDVSSHQYHNQCLHPSVKLKGTYVRTQKRSRNPRVLGNWQQLRESANHLVSQEPFVFVFLLKWLSLQKPQTFTDPNRWKCLWRVKAQPYNSKQGHPILRQNLKELNRVGCGPAICISPKLTIQARGRDAWQANMHRLSPGIMQGPPAQPPVVWSCKILSL